MSDCIFFLNSHPLWRGDHEPPCRPTISRFDNVTHKVVNERQLLTDSGFVFGASNNNKKKLKFILSLSKKGICPSFFQQFVTDPIVERPYRVIGWLPTPSFLCHFSITAITHISISSLIIFSPQFLFFLAKLPASSSSSRCDFLALLFSAAAAGELQNTWNDNGVHNRRLRSGIRTCGLYTTRGERKMGGME